MKYLDYINYLYLSGYLEILPKKRLAELIPTNFYDFCRRFFMITLESFKDLLKKRIKKKNLSKDWLVYQSKNNYETLKYFKDEENEFVKLFEDLDFRYLFLYKVIYIFPLLIKLSIKGKLNLFISYYTSLGYYEEALRTLKKNMPKRIFFANDHNSIQRAFLKAANNLGINTFYFQHAHITKFFPPLDFSVSFLDGQASYDIYKYIGNIKGKVELIGSMKLLKYKDVKVDRKKNSTIGIALNQNDRLKNIQKLISYINSNFKELKIIIRKHPRDQRIMALKGNYLISDSKSENVFDFLKNLSFLIAGNSSILLEAALINVYPFYYFPDGEEKYYDYYGFVKNGLAIELVEREDLEDFVVNPQDIDFNKRTKYYNKTLIKKDLDSLLFRHNIFIKC